MKGIKNELARILNDTCSAYSEYYVQSACYEIEGLLKDLDQMNHQIDLGMRKKANDLRVVVEIYNASEQKSKNIISEAAMSLMC